jgi:hypothetical protein
MNLCDLDELSSLQLSVDSPNPATHSEVLATEGPSPESSGDALLSYPYFESGSLQPLANTSSAHCDDPHSSHEGRMLFYPQSVDQVNHSKTHQAATYPEALGTEGPWSESSGDALLSFQSVGSGSFQPLATSSAHCDDPHSSHDGRMLFYPQSVDQINHSEIHHVSTISDSVLSSASSYSPGNGQSFSFISSYSSLLPEQHCLPFNNGDGSLCVHRCVK